MNRQVHRLMKSKASDDICTACSLSVSLPPLIKCVDCGEIVEIGEFDSKTCRCLDCQDKARKLKYSKYNDKRRGKS